MMAIVLMRSFLSIHDAGDAFLTFGDTACDITYHFGLAMFVFAGIAVRTVHDQTVCRRGFDRHFLTDQLHGIRHGFGVIVRAAARTTQYHMAVGIAKRFDYGRTTHMAVQAGTNLIA